MLIKTAANDLVENASLTTGNGLVIGTHTTNNTATAVSPGMRDWTVQVTLTCSSGNCSATVIVEVSNDNSNFITAGTATFTAAASPQVTGFASSANWAYVRSRCTAISGTNASAEVRLGL